MACTLLSCAQCCTVFSSFGFFFLIIIGSLLHTQPLYIKGIEDSAAASKNVYYSAVIYLGVFALSIIYITLDKGWKKAAALARGESSANSKIQFGGKYGAVVSEGH